jgi:dTDP-L-rhamnose 4-epimerase
MACRHVYGPGQALRNPYTGVLAIFASRLMNGRPPVIFEGGLQRLGFVHVEDVAQAFVAPVEGRGQPGSAYIIASGEDRTVLDVARLLARAMEPGLRAEISQKARTGDIRHCIADISLARQELGFARRRDLEAGLSEPAEWVSARTADDRVSEAHHELKTRGLVS